jgi:hypothetical protein
MFFQKSALFTLLAGMQVMAGPVEKQTVDIVQTINGPVKIYSVSAPISSNETSAVNRRHINDSCGENNVICGNNHEAFKTACQALLDGLNAEPDHRVDANTHAVYNGESPNKCVTSWVHTNDEITWGMLIPAAQKAFDNCGANLVSATIHYVELAGVCNTQCLSNGDSNCSDNWN